MIDLVKKLASVSSPGNPSMPKTLPLTAVAVPAVLKPVIQSAPVLIGVSK